MRPDQRLPAGRLSQRQTPTRSAYRARPASRLHLYGRYLLMRSKVRLAYRGDFVLNAAGDLLVATIGIIFLWAVFVFFENSDVGVGENSFNLSRALFGLRPNAFFA